jgi:transcriptional regulator of arginine metabolism
MNTKAARQKAILEVISGSAVPTQARLKKFLKARGVGANQATLSRDIRELGLVKTSADGIHARYAPVESVAPPYHRQAGALLARLVKKVEWSGNLLVIKTDPGEASPVGLALDHMGWPEVAGTVAGDDTLLLVVKEGVAARKLAKKILDLKTHRKDTA